MRSPESLAQRKAYNKAYREKNCDRLRGYITRWRKENAPRVRARLYVKKYGLTPEQHAALLERQVNACAICLRSDVLLQVDHNHTTGAVRGLLCGPCNLGIGKFNDDPDVLTRATAYIRANKP